MTTTSAQAGDTLIDDDGKLCRHFFGRDMALARIDVTEKPALRRLARRRRQALRLSERVRAENQVCRHVLALPQFRRLHRIALYMSMGSEFPTGRLLQCLRRAGHVVCLPVIVGQRLRFAPVAGKLRLGKHGIAAPVSRIRLSARAVNLLLMPLLAFDAQGMRLGQGGGYYDRTLAGAGRWPRRIGLAFAAQALPPLPAGPHDVSLHGVLTERGYQTFRR